MIIRLDKFLSNIGFGSRAEVKDFIKKNGVLVNSNKIYKVNQQIDTEKDLVEVDGRSLKYKKYLYLMMNKPKGFISASEGRGKKTVIDLLDEKLRNKGLFPAGRLDKDTEGFILLTNDGKFAHNLLSPKKKKFKKYYVELREPLRDKDKEVFEKGILLKPENKLTQRAHLEILSNKTAYVFITEGKYHQVKRMFKACGNEVIYLKRTAISGVELDEKLKLGEYRELYPEEIKILKDE